MARLASVDIRMLSRHHVLASSGISHTVSDSTAGSYAQLPLLPDIAVKLQIRVVLVTPLVRYMALAAVLMYSSANVHLNVGFYNGNECCSIRTLYL
jgi:hypothetical protein